MSLIKWDQPAKLASRRNWIENFFSETDDFFKDFNWDRSADVPAVNVRDEEKQYLIELAAPGMKKEDFNLEVNDGTLTLSGERKSEPLTDGVAYHRAERVNGKFSRSFYLPQSVQQDGIKANYRDGILEIHVPKAEEAKPRQIAITLS